MLCCLSELASSSQECVTSMLSLVVSDATVLLHLPVECWAEKKLAFAFCKMLPAQLSEEMTQFLK